LKLDGVAGENADVPPVPEQVAFLSVLIGAL
jgi:hypothetical protein